MIIVISLAPLIKLKLPKLDYRLTFSIAGGVAFYLLLFSHINQELWGDELEVLRLAYLPFGRIANEVFKQHVSSPPMDYWNLSLWRYVAEILPTYREFIFRVPYMTFHLIAATLFALAVDKGVGNRNKVKGVDIRGALYFVAFFTYFFNPLLFAYSIEVKFYALSALGVVIVLSLFISDRFLNLKYLPLLLLFCLNSVFQFVIVAPFLLIFAIRTQTSIKKLMIFSGSFLTMFIMIWPRLSFYEITSRARTLDLIAKAMNEFVTIHLSNNAQVIGLFIVLGIILLQKKTRQQAVILIGVLIFYLFTISLSEYIGGYLWFGVRYYIYVVPVLLFLIFLVFKNKLFARWIVILGILVLYLYPWQKFITRMVLNKYYFSKDLIGSKYVLEFANREGLEVVVVPNNNRSINQEIFSWYIHTLKLYAQFYPSVQVTYVPKNINVCERLSEGGIVLFSIHAPLPCDNGAEIVRLKTDGGSVLGVRKQYNQ